jgi:hypothetical protein
MAGKLVVSLVGASLIFIGTAPASVPTFIGVQLVDAATTAAICGWLFPSELPR